MNPGLLQREICSQPEVLERFRRLEGAGTFALGTELAALRPAGVLIAARGSSDHAAVYAKYALGVRLGLPVALAAPSLFTVYDALPDLRGWVVLAISQSGASPDVVAVIERARSAGCTTVALTDLAGSDLAGAAERVVSLRVGGEHSVAATGSFTASLYALAHLVAGWDASSSADRELEAVPERLSRTLGAEAQARAVAERVAASDRCVVLGRGYGFPAALEISLKLKEVAALFAEPFSAADYRHGPIALAGAGTRALVIDVEGPARRDVRALLADLDARGVECLRLGDDSQAAVPFPAGPEWLAPIPAVIAGQLVALHAAKARGLDPDQPQGITKITRTF